MNASITFYDFWRIIKLPKKTKSQAVARIADRTASQHLGSRDVIGNVTIW